MGKRIKCLLPFFLTIFAHGYSLIAFSNLFLRDDIVHGKGKSTVRESVFFLKNYYQMLNSEIPK
jgi:hypothetical protein